MTALSTSVASIFSPYLAIAAEAAVMKAGESTTEGARRLYRWLLEELAGRRTNEALEYLRAQLQTGAQATLRVQLCGALETEPSCAQGLAALLGELTAEKLGVTQAKRRLRRRCSRHPGSWQGRCSPCSMRAALFNFREPLARVGTSCVCLAYWIASFVSRETVRPELTVGSRKSGPD